MFNAHNVRADILEWILSGYAMGNAHSKIKGLRGLASVSDRELRDMYRSAGTRAVRSGQYSEVLPLGPAHNAKTWNIARSLGYDEMR